MNFFEVSFWQEGPGRSHVEKAIIVANNKKEALEFTKKYFAVYKQDHDSITVKKIKGNANVARFISWVE